MSSGFLPALTIYCTINAISPFCLYYFGLSTHFREIGSGCLLLTHFGIMGNLLHKLSQHLITRFLSRGEAI